jgi:hypothetical protein
VRYRVNGAAPVVVDWSSRVIHDPPNPHNVYWSRNSQLIVGIAYQPPVEPETSGTLYLVASLGGEAPVAESLGGIGVTFPLGYEFSLLKFRGVTNGVVTFKWYGGQALDTTLSIEQFFEQFASLSFLEEPP